MKINKETLKQMIRESIHDQLAQIKERSNSATTQKAESVVKILKQQAESLTKLAEHAGSLHEDSQYSELAKQKGMLEQLAAQKLQKAESISKRYGLQEKKKIAKPKPKSKVVDTKKVGPKKVSEAAPKAKPAAASTKKLKEAAKGKGSIASVKAQVKKANKK